MNDIRTTEQVTRDIKELVKTKGFIYALCMILFDDLLFDPEKLHEIDYYSRLSRNEISLLLGFLIQNEIDFSIPDTPQDLLELKQKIYEIMEELHSLLNNPAVIKLQEIFKSGQKKGDNKKEHKAFWDSGDMFVEPIFYSGDGVYDFQYLNYLDKKYKYDKEWLLNNVSFDTEESKSIVQKIRDILQNKPREIHPHRLKEKIPQMIEEIKESNPNEDLENFALLEFLQYLSLFFIAEADKKTHNIDEVREKGWKSFYNGLIELFVIRKSDFNDNSSIDSFFENFSLIPSKDSNSQFQGVGDYNLLNSNPIIQLDEERYFIPIILLVFEAIYESPFYWMQKDISYRDTASRNRGLAGEEIVFELLSKVFSKERIFKSVKISAQKGRNATDIDVLCVLGSKALCVQVKSKKLTLLSRKGDDNQLQKDFQGAVQDAYKQGLVSRQKILNRDAKFFDENNNEILLSEDIDEVCIMGITTENYPSITHQAQVKLEKKDNDPYAIFTTIFDLELMVHYLNDPYDFLYYIRQRISLMDYFDANSEIEFLGYHLVNKLCKIPEYDKVSIDTQYAQLIDRNYIPLNPGKDVSDESDTIKSRWGNRDFNKLCDKLKSSNLPQITDIIFHLLDLPGDGRKNLVDQIIVTKHKTSIDNKYHDFSLNPDDKNAGTSFGITYISSNNNNKTQLDDKLQMCCIAKKYRCKSDAWIGFGCVKDSPEIIDIVVFNDAKWEYNEELEKISSMILGEEKIISNKKS